jgi:Leucine-rich repeat (LRR) protein
MEQDGELDIDQFQVALHVIQELDKFDKQLGRDGDQPLLQLLPHEAFDMMDADNDGKLDKLEFNEALRSLNVVPFFSNQLNGEAFLKKLWTKVLKMDLPPGEPMPSYARIRHFENAFLELCDVEAELKARGIVVPRESILSKLSAKGKTGSLMNVANANDCKTAEEKKKENKKWLEKARKALHDHIATEEKREREIMQKARSQGWERKRQERIKIERVKQAQKHQAEKEAHEVRLSQANKEKSDRAADKARGMQASKAKKFLKDMKHETKKLKDKRQKEETKERKATMNRRLHDAENAVLRNGWDRIDYSGKRLLELPKEIYWYKQKREKGEEAKRLSSVRILNLSKNHLTGLPEKGLFFHLDELQKMDVSFNKLEQFPDELRVCKKMQVFIANNNHLGNIEDTSPFKNFDQLVRLELSSNRIATFSKNILKKFLLLKSLSLANNALEIVPAEIGVLAHLRAADLHGNMIHTIGKEGGFSRLTAMHTLDLSNNKLESLPDDFGELASLVDLNLSHNRLRWLPESIGELPEIQRANLSRNQLVQIPDEIGRLSGLIDLDISWNDLTYMPEATGGWVALESLHICNNHLANLPSSCGKWTSLQELQVQCNRIKIMPLEVGSWFNLEYLDFHENKITEIPKEVGHMTALRNLSLAQNLIETVPESVSLMKNLKILSMQENALRSFPESIRYVTSLENLNLASNVKLRQVPRTLGDCGQLRHLNLCSCGLTALPVELAKLTSLQTLLLTHNKLNMLPVEYVNILPILLKFDIQKNPMKFLPERWCKEWNVHRETRITETGYTSTEAAVWIQQHSRLYPVLLTAYQECLAFDDGGEQKELNTKGQGAFSGKRAQQIFAKHSAGVPPYRLPVRLNDFIDRVKDRRSVRWSEDAQIAAVHFYQFTREQGGLPPKYEQLYESEWNELQEKKKSAAKGIERKIKWTRDVYTELKEIAKEAYSRFLDEASLQWLEEKLRTEHAERKKLKKTAQFNSLMEEVKRRRVRQDEQAHLIQEKREYDKEQEMIRVKQEILRLKAEATRRRKIEEERKRLELEAERRRHELLEEAANTLDESSMTSTESSLISINGPLF